MTNHIVLLVEDHVVKVCENYFSFQDAMFRASQLNLKQFIPNKNELWNGSETIFEASEKRYLGIVVVRHEESIF